MVRKPPPRLLEYCGGEYRPYYNLLHLLALHTDGACVELGVEKGRGCLAMALAGRETWGVDNNLRLEAKSLAADTPGLHVLEASSTPPPARVVEEVGGRIAVLHVDTEHSFLRAKAEWEAWLPHLRPRAVVCFDDTHAMADEVGRFVVGLQRPTILDDRLHECGYGVVICA